jgi:SAF domain
MARSIARERQAPPAPLSPAPVVGLRGTPAAIGERRRHPWWLLGAVAMMVTGVLVSAWVFTTSSHTVRVLVAARDLTPGEVLDGAGVQVVSMAKLGAARSISVNEQQQVVGMAARGPVPAGTLLHPGLFAHKEDVVPAGQVVVGAALDPGAVPSPRIAVGDSVQLFATERASNAATAATDAATQLTAGRIWSVEKLGTATSSGKLWLGILVPAEAGAAVTQAAGDGRLRLVLVGTGQ